MTLWRHLKRGLRAPANRTVVDQDIDDEVAQYLEQAADELVAKGFSEEEARQRARMAFGNTTLIHEEMRTQGWENAIETLFADFRYASRQLRHRPGFTAVSGLTLALGIGASTAIFSAVNPVLFEPLPYPHASRIVAIWDRGDDGSHLEGTFGTYRELAERSRSFDAISVLKAWQPTMNGLAEPERLDGQSVGAGYFHVLGVAPMLGRDFDPSEDQLHGARVAILSDGLWRRRFGADPTIIGRPFILDGDTWTVIGVMPSGFENVLSPSAEIWSPLQYDMSIGAAWGHHLRIVGRLRPGVGVDQARQELEKIARTPAQDFPRPPWASMKQGLGVSSLKDDVTGGIKPALLAVLGAVVLLLAIACVNVTNLLLARGTQRRGEFAVRAALGAGGTRIVRQLMTESLLLAIFGGALGMVVAGFGVRALAALALPGLSRVEAIGLNGGAFAFAFGIAALVGLAVGLVPGLQASRCDLRSGLQQISRRTATGHQSTRGLLVVAEVAIAVVLLVSSGLLLRSLQHLFAVAPGFNPSHLLTMQVQTSGHQFDDDRATQRFFAQALETVRGVPGVMSAALTSQLPLSDDQFGIYGVYLESGRKNYSTPAFRYAVSPGYFETMGIPLRRGRLLDARDTSGAPLAVLISESLAKKAFPGEVAVGKRIHAGPENSQFATIAGVVGDVKQTSLAVSQADAFYMTAAQGWFTDRAMSLVVRTRGDAAALVPAIKQAIWTVDKGQPIVRVSSMDALVAASAAQRRFVLILLEVFGVVALALAAIGIYGVLSSTVADRTREIGLRSALGASRGEIIGLVLRQGMTLTALGGLIGSIGAIAATQAILTMLFGISPLDPITYISVVGLLAGVSAIACWIPAWRAARVDPSITLRAD